MECLRNNFHDGVVLGGRYQTIAPLNHGSFGMVFMANDLRTNQTVAIKCVRRRDWVPHADVPHIHLSVT
jgi:serine/threonine protein kinase